jgi:transcriptional regulator with XRE-family HTH domain
MAGLRALRQRRMLTQRELAAEVGVAHQTVQAWESGKNLPQAPKMRRLAEVLAVTADELMRAFDTSPPDVPAQRHESPAKRTFESKSDMALTEELTTGTLDEAKALWEMVTNLGRADSNQCRETPPVTVAAAILGATERIPGGKRKQTQAVAQLLVQARTQTTPFLRWLLQVAEALEMAAGDRANTLLNLEPAARSATRPPRRRKTLLGQIKEAEGKRQAGAPDLLGEEA